MWGNQCRISPGRLSRRTWLFWRNSIGVRLSASHFLGRIDSKGFLSGLKSVTDRCFDDLKSSSITLFQTYQHIGSPKLSKTYTTLTQSLISDREPTPTPSNWHPPPKTVTFFFIFFTFKHPRPQWIQAQKTGAVINFNRWRDWDGKSLRGLDWYKEEEAKEYEG